MPFLMDREPEKHIDILTFVSYSHFDALLMINHSNETQGKRNGKGQQKTEE